MNATCFFSFETVGFLTSTKTYLSIKLLFSGKMILEKLVLMFE